MNDIEQYVRTNYDMRPPSEIRAGDHAINVVNGQTIWTAVTDAHVDDDEYDGEVVVVVEFPDGTRLDRHWNSDQVKLAIVRSG